MDRKSHVRNTPHKGKSNIPRLRFSGFEGEWQTKKLGEVLTIGNGQDYKHLSEGDIPVYGTGGYMTSVNDYLYDGETVCIGRKGTINKPFYFNEKFWTVDTLFYTHSFKNAVPKFIYYTFKNINWLKYNEASGVPSLSKSTIIQIEIKIPSIEEQQKIASFLSLIDQRIATQNKILLRYQSLIQNLRNNIFKQKMRFKNEDGNNFSDWGITKLGSVAEKRISKNKQMQIKTVLSNSASFGIINQSDFFDKEIANQNNINGYYVVEKDDFVYNPRISKEAPVGPISRNKIDIGVMSPLYMVFRFKEGHIDFFEHFFNSNGWYEHMESIANYGARADRMSFSNSDFFEMPMPIPSIQEQKRIASFLSKIDQKIQTEKVILEQLEIQKKYLLQQMFV